MGITVESGVRAGLQQCLPPAVQFPRKQQPFVIDIMVDCVTSYFFEDAAQIIFIDIKPFRQPVQG